VVLSNRSCCSHAPPDAPRCRGSRNIRGMGSDASAQLGVEWTVRDTAKPVAVEQRPPGSVYRCIESAP
jgi:hypothetical protein